MNRKQHTIFLMVVFWAVVIGAAGIWYWRADSQERLNLQLITAIKREDMPAALVALERGADGNARDEPVVPGWKRIWDLLRGRRAVPSTAPTALLLLLQGRQNRGSRIIHVPKEDPELVRALLAHEAKPNELDLNGYSPLYFALMNHHMHTARLLIKRGANVTDRSSRWNLLALEIISCRDTSLAESMLEHGADLNRAEPPWDLPPLGAAVYEKNLAMVRLLLQHHADPNVEYVTGDSDTMPLLTHPLQYAERKHMTEIAQLLRDAGAKR